MLASRVLLGAGTEVAQNASGALIRSWPRKARTLLGSGPMKKKSEHFCGSLVRRWWEENIPKSVVKACEGGVI